MYLLNRIIWSAKLSAMNLIANIAKQIRELHFGGNWTDVNLKQTLTGVMWQQAKTKVQDLNTIAALVFYINYYTSAVLRVLEGAPLTSSNTFSFDLPPIQCNEDWENLKNKNWEDAEKFANLVEQFPAGRLGDVFTHEKYESYYKNLQGIIEHGHYHLGQIVLIKKMVQQL